MRRRLLKIAIAAEIGAAVMLAFALWTGSQLAAWLVLAYVVLAAASIAAALGDEGHR